MRNLINARRNAAKPIVLFFRWNFLDELSAYPHQVA